MPADLDSAPTRPGNRWMIRWIAVTLVVAACARGPAIPPVPSQGGPAWTELSSEHFTLWTDAPLDVARELMRQMEDLRQVVVGTAFSTVGGTGKSFVIALRDPDEIHGYIPEQFAAIASPPEGNAIHQALIMLPAESKRQDVEITAAHELTHVISYSLVHHQPRWFAEGLAKFFETIEIDRKASTVDLGRSIAERGGPRRVHHFIPLRAMFGCGSLACADQGFYATAWALFTYLFNTQSERLARLEQRLDELTPNNAGAWDEVFADLPLDRLEVDLRQWIVSGSHKVLHFNVRLQQHAVTERPLTDADIYAARAVLESQFAGRAAASDAAASEALRLDPTNVLALTMAYSLHHTVDADRARAAVAAHPDDWRAWLLVVLALKTGDEATQAHAKMCELAAGNLALAAPCKR
jgi:Protein of unknown function (DUF1570)